MTLTTSRRESQTQWRSPLRGHPGPRAILETHQAIAEGASLVACGQLLSRMLQAGARCVARVDLHGHKPNSLWIIKAKPQMLSSCLYLSNTISKDLFSKALSSSLRSRERGQAVHITCNSKVCEKTQLSMKTSRKK